MDVGGIDRIRRTIRTENECTRTADEWLIAFAVAMSLFGFFVVAHNDEDRARLFAIFVPEE